MNSPKTLHKVPLLDLSFQYNNIEEEIYDAFKSVFSKKQFILGEPVLKLEEEISSYCGTDYAVGVSSGSDALLISLMALDIGPGDEVITTPFSFFATAGCISRVGATPVFVDIDPKTFNINPELIKDKITSNTKAIIPVHLFGQMANMDRIMAIAEENNLNVIEDAAQAIGSQYNFNNNGHKRAGSIGDVGCFSFFPSKNLGCCGDGGIVTTSNKELYEKLVQFRNHGSIEKYKYGFVGGNFRLDALQAAILSVKLPHLESQHSMRQSNADYYNTNFNNSITSPFIDPKCISIFNQYTIRHSRRDDLQHYLNEHTIGNCIYYPISLHVQPCFSNLGYKEGDCPESEKASKEVISLPVFPGLTQDQLDYIVEVINSFN